MTVSAEEFIRRFLLHVLPPGFQRIRYYGLLGNRYREQKLARCRELLGMRPSETPPAEASPDYRDRYHQLTGSSLWECPVCHRGGCWRSELWTAWAHAQPSWTPHDRADGAENPCPGELGWAEPAHPLR